MIAPTRMTVTIFIWVNYFNFKILNHQSFRVTLLYKAANDFSLLTSGIAVLVAAAFFGYMLALLHYRIKALFSSRNVSILFSLLQVMSSVYSLDLNLIVHKTIALLYRIPTI